MAETWQFNEWDELASVARVLDYPNDVPELSESLTQVTNRTQQLATWISSQLAEIEDTQLEAAYRLSFLMVQLQNEVLEKTLEVLRNVSISTAHLLFGNYSDE